MPIIQPRKDVPQLPPKPVLTIAKPDAKNIAVDLKYNPKETLLSHVEGMSWTIDYYSQVLGRDTQPKGLELGLDPAYQQYKLINAMEVKVTSALQASQDNETNEMAEQGTATVYPFVIPNKGDMFVADLLDGRRAIFQITDVKRLSVFREAVHSIDYSLVNFGEPAWLDNLKRKTVQTTYFEKDFIAHGQNPVLVSDDYENLQFLRRQYGTLVTQYFKRYYSREYATLILPDQPNVTYDAFLVRAVFQHLTTWDARELTNLRQLNCDDDQVMASDSIWTVLMERNRALLADAFQTVGYVGARTFTYEPMMEGIRYSGVEHVIYPNDPMVRVDNQFEQNVKAAGEFVPVRSTVPPRKTLASLMSTAQQAEDGDPTKVGIKDTFTDGYYVFSKAFYDNDRTTESAQSDLELAVQDYLDSKEIAYDRMRALVEASVRWDNVNSFYFIPVLLILIKSVIRAI
jgi:hypothetical protein